MHRSGPHILSKRMSFLPTYENFPAHLICSCLTEKWNQWTCRSTRYKLTVKKNYKKELNINYENEFLFLAAIALSVKSL